MENQARRVGYTSLNSNETQIYAIPKDKGKIKEREKYPPSTF